MLLKTVCLLFSASMFARGSVVGHLPPVDGSTAYDAVSVRSPASAPDDSVAISGPSPRPRLHSRLSSSDCAIDNLSPVSVQFIIKVQRSRDRIHTLIHVLGELTENLVRLPTSTSLKVAKELARDSGDIYSCLSATVRGIPTKEALGDAALVKIVHVFARLLHVSQTLLNAVIENRDIFAKFDLDEEIGSICRNLKVYFNAFPLVVIDFSLNKEATLETEITALGRTVNQCVNAYALN